MVDKLNILILYRLGDPSKWRKSLSDLEFILPKEKPEHNYLAHPVEMPLPPFVKDIQFDGIIFGSTFLYARNLQGIYGRILKDYEFLRDSSAIKIALPQDDYFGSEYLDNWMVDWGVDHVFTVCPDYWDLLYPKYLKSGKKLKLGYTGYIFDEMIQRWQNPKPHKLRSIDVSYRSHRIHGYFGQLGYAKANIGDIFKKNINDNSLVLDISTNEEDTIPGSKWLDFVEDSKCCLATNSGSSLLDPIGEIRKKVNRYIARHPDATFDQVEKNCYQGLDGKYVFTAISPRNFEAALAETVQIATPASYNNILKPDEHYIPFNLDLSNIAEVRRKIRDKEFLVKVARNAKSAILSQNDLRASFFASTLVELIVDGISNKSIGRMSNEKMAGYIARYSSFSSQYARSFWRKRRMINKSKQILKKVGFKKFRILLKGY